MKPLNAVMATWVVLIGTLLSVKAEATVILFNTLPNNTTNGIPAKNTLGTGGPLGQTFLTDGNADILNQVVLQFQRGGVSNANSVVVTLNADTGGVPGSVLTTLGSVADSAVGTGTTTITFSGLTYALSSNTNYYIEVTDTNNNTGIKWDQNTTTTTGDVGTSGSSQYYVTSGVGTATMNASTPFSMEVIVFEPEPMTLAILGVGLAGIGWTRRRRRMQLASVV